jgi:hypothetical protein
VTTNCDLHSQFTITSPPPIWVSPSKLSSLTGLWYDATKARFATGKTQC